MIDTKKPKVKEVLERIHEKLGGKVSRSGRTRDDFVLESRLMASFCLDADAEPTDCARWLRKEYGYDVDASEVIHIFKERNLGNPDVRRELISWAEEIGKLFIKAMQGDKDSFLKFDELSRKTVVKHLRKRDLQSRIAVIYIYERYPEIDVYNEKENIYLFGNTLARYFFLDMSDAICEAYNFSSPHLKQAAKSGADKMSAEQAMEKIGQLENMLARTNTMLEDLQEEFDEQLAESKVRELTDFFLKLNSEKYGCILDGLLVTNRNIDALRKSGYDMPLEVSNMLTLIKKMIQFVRDSHIEPIMKINSVKDVTASDIEFCNYEGTPFSSSSEVKKVRVISSGWVFRDKDIQISRPKVKEEVE